jgi:hypothetical protein
VTTSRTSSPAPQSPVPSTAAGRRTLSTSMDWRLVVLLVGASLMAGVAVVLFLRAMGAKAPWP